MFWIPWIPCNNWRSLARKRRKTVKGDGWRFFLAVSFDDCAKSLRHLQSNCRSGAMTHRNLWGFATHWCPFKEIQRDPRCRRKHWRNLAIRWRQWGRPAYGTMQNLYPDKRQKFWDWHSLGKTWNRRKSTSHCHHFGTAVRSLSGQNPDHQGLTGRTTSSETWKKPCCWKIQQGAQLHRKGTSNCSCWNHVGTHKCGEVLR